MNFEQLRYLITTIENKSVSNAAKQLYISQSALSQSIINLEKELNVPLLLRTNSGVYPTYYGNQIYQNAKPLIENFDHLYKALHKTNEDWETPGNVTVVSIPSVSDVIADFVIPDVTLKYTSSNFSLIEHFPVEDEIQLMKEKNASICIGGCTVEKFSIHQELAAQSGYSLDILEKNSPTILLMSSKNKLSKNSSINLFDCAELSLAFYASEKEPVSFKYFNQKKAYRLNDKKMVMKFIYNNQAVGIYPAYIKQNETLIKNKSIKALNVISDDPSAFPNVCSYLIHKPYDEMSPMETIFVNAAKYYLTTSFS